MVVGPFYVLGPGESAPNKCLETDLRGRCAPAQAWRCTSRLALAR